MSQENADKMRILVVDDSLTVRRTLHAILEKHDYDVVSVEGAEKALELLDSERFDIVLLDLMMPEISGASCLRTIRKDLGLKDLPVIFVTAISDPTQIAAAFEAGGTDYVTKPIDGAALVARIKAHLGVASMRKAAQHTRHRLNSVQNALGALTRIMTPAGYAIDLHPVSITHVFDAIQRGWQPIAETEDIAFVLDDSEVSGSLMTHEPSLLCLLNSLLAEAMGASDAGTTVQVVGEERGNQIRISIVDESSNELRETEISMAGDSAKRTPIPGSTSTRFMFPAVAMSFGSELQSIADALDVKLGGESREGMGSVRWVDIRKS